MPFAWSDAPVEQEDRPAKTVMDDACSIGLCNGFIVPIYTTQGCNALVTFGAERFDMPAQERAAVHLISIYAHARVRDLMGTVPGGTRRTVPHLAVREIECLSWTAEGKSAWDISKILNLSQRIETHPIYLTRILETGWHARPLALPQEVDGQPVVPILAGVNKATLERSRQVFGIHHSVLEPLVADSPAPIDPTLPLESV